MPDEQTLLNDSVRRKIELVNLLFPESCPICYDGEGNTSYDARLIIDKAFEDESSGKQKESPCYSCIKDPSQCNVRQIAFHDEDNRYLSV